MTSSSADSSAVKALQRELKSLNDKPVEGFTVESVDPTNIFQWTVIIYGPPRTLYQGGYFKPNINSPANVDASVAYTKWVDSKGADHAYVDTVISIVGLSKAQAITDGVVVPTTVDDYCRAGVRMDSDEGCGDEDDDYGFYTDDVLDDGDDDDDLPSSPKPTVGV